MGKDLWIPNFKQMNPLQMGCSVLIFYIFSFRLCYLCRLPKGYCWPACPCLKRVVECKDTSTGKAASANQAGKHLDSAQPKTAVGLASTQLALSAGFCTGPLIPFSQYFWGSLFSLKRTDAKIWNKHKPCRYGFKKEKEIVMRLLRTITSPRAQPLGIF